MVTMSALKDVTAEFVGKVSTPSSITLPATSTTGNYTVSWTASATAGVTYTLQESTDPAFGTFTETANAVSPAAITGKANGTYYYRVKAVKALMQDSAWVNGACEVLFPPVAPTLVGPSGAGQSVTPTYTWTASPLATSYTLITNVSGVLATTVLNAATVCSGTSCSYLQPTPFALGNTVNYSLNAKNSSGSSAWANGSFKVGP